MYWYALLMSSGEVSKCMPGGRRRHRLEVGTLTLPLRQETAYQAGPCPSRLVAQMQEGLQGGGSSLRLAQVSHREQLLVGLLSQAQTRGPVVALETLLLLRAVLQALRRRAETSSFKQEARQAPQLQAMCLSLRVCPLGVQGAQCSFQRALEQWMAAFLYEMHKGRMLWL